MNGNATAPIDFENLFAAHARSDDPLFVVEMSGELDLGSSTAAIRACTSTDQRHVLVDLSGLTFMDCAGYGALASSATILETRGGSLVMMNPIGEPRRLFDLIERMGDGLCAPLRYGDLLVSPAMSGTEWRQAASMTVG